MVYPEYAKVNVSEGTAETTTPDSAENLAYRVAHGFLPALHNHLSEIPNGKVEVEDCWTVENGYAVCSYKLADAPSDDFTLPDGSKLVVERNELGEKSIKVV